MTTSYHLPQREHRTGRQKSLATSAKNLERTASQNRSVHSNDETNEMPPPIYSPTKSEYDSSAMKGTHQHVPIYLARQNQHEHGYEHEHARSRVYNEHHEIALQELTSRRATPPPFPSSLPERLNVEGKRDKKQQRRRKMMMLIMASIIFALVTVIVTLGVLLAMSKQMKGLPSQPSQGNFLPPPSNGSTAGALSAGTKTITIEHTQATTYTVLANSTTATSTSAERASNTTSTPAIFNITINPLLIPSPVPSVSSTSTSTPTSTEGQAESEHTTEPSSKNETCDSSSNQKSNMNLTLSAQYCLFMSSSSSCTDTSSSSSTTTIPANIESNDCLDFCRINFGNSTMGTTEDPNMIVFQNSAAAEAEKNTGYRNLCDDLGLFESISGSGSGSRSRSRAMARATADQNDIGIGAMAGRIRTCCAKCGCFGG